jgi:hypothetical protein
VSRYHSAERIVLGGWAGLTLGTRLLPEIRRATSAHALRHAYEQTSIELCQLGPDAVAVGAATLPVEVLLEHGADTRRPARPAMTREGRRWVSTSCGGWSASCPSSRRSGC